MGIYYVVKGYVILWTLLLFMSMGWDWLNDWLWWGCDWCLRTAVITSLLFILRVNVTGQPWWWRWWLLGITPNLFTRACWQSYQQRHLERAVGMDEGKRILHIQYLWYVNGSFTCRKILWHGTSGFTSHLKEGVLLIFIVLTKPSPRPGLNMWLVGPAASTLTTTPLRRHDGVRLCLCTVVTNSLIVHSSHGYLSMEPWLNDIMTGENWRTWRKPYPITNPTWTDLGANPDHGHWTVHPR
jgi:hypothetical protein